MTRPPFRRKRSQVRSPHTVDFRQPGFRTYYWLGVEASRELTPLESYSAIGKTVGLTPQNTYSAAMVALGKLVFAIRQEARTLQIEFPSRPSRPLRETNSSLCNP